MFQRDYALGKRIAVRGVTGSGKSTLTRALGEALGLRVIELDAIQWQTPGWQPMPADEFRAGIEAALAAAPTGWVCDGNYTAESRGMLAQADTLIWLNLPWRVTFWRLLKRTFSRAAKRELLWGTQRESLRQTLLSRNSILWWSISHYRDSVRHSRALLAETRHARTYELRSAQEVRELLEVARRQTVTLSAYNEPQA